MPAAKDSSKKSKPKQSRRPVRAGRNAPRSEKIQTNFVKVLFNRTFLTVAAALIASLLIIAGIFTWFNKVYADPENVFWGMVDNNLATSGVSKEVLQRDAQNSSQEVTQLSWNPEPRVRTIRELSFTQGGATTKVVLEAIITPKDQYQRYAKIDRPGPDRDYSKIYNLWLKNGGGGAQSDPSAFNNAAYGVMLFGNFNRDDRKSVVDGLRKAYKVDFSNIQKQIEEGRRNYSYSVTINLREYAKAAQAYAKRQGLPDAGLLNPNNYRDTDEIKATFVIDVLSRQIKQVRYQSPVTENYSGYGIPSELKLPGRTVKSDELQKTIQSLTQ